uniref:Uncharacterized protein n=1 Tax=Tenebrio molitor TaxID=7067 RepID=A0A8J6LBD9_TENMO|nr:hypothetical protein GEV33_015260 [Tenebrio molitor]
MESRLLPDENTISERSYDSTAKYESIPGRIEVITIWKNMKSWLSGIYVGTTCGRI